MNVELSNPLRTQLDSRSIRVDWHRLFTIVIHCSPFQLSIEHFLQWHVGSEGSFFDFKFWCRLLVGDVGRVPHFRGDAGDIDDSLGVLVGDVFDSEKDDVLPNGNGNKLDGSIDATSLNVFGVMINMRVRIGREVAKVEEILGW